MVLNERKDCIPRTAKQPPSPCTQKKEKNEIALQNLSQKQKRTQFQVGYRNSLQVTLTNNWHVWRAYSEAGIVLNLSPFVLSLQAPRQTPAG